VLESRRQGVEHLTGGPIEVLRRESRELARLSNQEPPKRDHLGAHDAERQPAAQVVERGSQVRCGDADDEFVVLAPKSRALTRCLGGFGVSMIVAAVFPADPVDGFPPGTPEGFPTSISTTGLVHFIVGALGFTFLAISCFFAAWAMVRRKIVPLALLSLLSGLAVVLGFFGGMVLPVGILGIWFAVVVGWAWLAVMSLRLNHLA
jgi:hypothetical protein